jgi:[protein-PII] uridylyltransferase
MPADDHAAARSALLHGPAADGTARRAGLARLTDDWLAGLFGAGVPGAALVAVGGYGRGELSPHSDLDLLLLHERRADGAAVAALAERLWYPVWDQGLPLDHSVRSPDEALEVAAHELTVQLGLLDARHLAGDPALTAGLRDRARAQWRATARRRLPELRESVAARAARHGELRFLLEPDLKEAHGGLRDATALRAVAASWLADPPQRILRHAHRELLDVRDALHLTAGRRTDRLLREDQPAVADALGHRDADALLRRLYEAAGALTHAADLTWREAGRVLGARSRRSRRGTRTPLADGVVLHDGEAVLARTARPEQDPALPLRAAAAAARAGVPLAPATVRRLAPALRRLPVPWPAQARAEFVALLGAGPGTVRVWEALEHEGLITALLPDWEQVRCRPQHNPVHRWTVDRHLVETAVRASALTRRVHRPDLLLIAALLHDLGKGLPGDHAPAGAEPARRAAARIGFCTADAERVGLLVRHHLLLPETATRRDLDDPATARAVAAAVGDRPTLDLLHALTEADALATGPAAWTAWRAGLVRALAGRVAAVLDGEAVGGGEGPGEETTDARAAEMAATARRTGAPVLVVQDRDEAGKNGATLLVAVTEQPGVLPGLAGLASLHRLAVRGADLRRLTVDDAAGTDGTVLLLRLHVAAAYGPLPAQARLRADLLRILDGSLDLAVRLAERAAAYRDRYGRPASAPPAWVRTVPGGSRSATVVEVRAADAPGLLHRLALALDRAGVRVRSAHVSTLGVDAVDAFYVTGPDNRPLPPPAAAALARAVEAELSAREPHGR